MAQKGKIPVNDRLAAEIESLRNAGKELSGPAEEEGESALPAAFEYRRRCRDTAEIIRMFGTLIDRDTGEADSFFRTENPADSGRRG